MTDKDTLDVSNFDAVRGYITLLPEKPDYIFHLAAETDLEWCQKNPAQAYYVNSFGTSNVSLLAFRFDIPIVYMSTAGVFHGNKFTYFEDDKTNAVNHYGRSKSLGEAFVSMLPKHYIFRMSWAMGGGPGVDIKFVEKSSGT